MNLGLMVTGTGMLIVFAVLIGLAFIISLFKYFNKSHDAAATAEVSTSNSVVEEALIVAEDDQEDEEELIAVLTAAVAASLGSAVKGKLVVKSFRRIPMVSPVWNTTGRKELLERKLL